MAKRKPMQSGSQITVTAELFDKLLAAGLLQVTGYETPADGKSWPTYGAAHDDGSVTCVLS